MMKHFCRIVISMIFLGLLFCTKSEAEAMENPEELFAGYVEKVFYEDLYEVPSVYANVGMDKLKNEEEQKIYSALKDLIADVAEGKLESTQISIKETFCWTAEELGVSCITSDNYKPLAMEKFAETINMNNIVKYLLMDCPYELYWYDKTTPIYTSLGITYEEQSVSVVQVIVKMPVAEAYQKNDIYRMDISKIKNVQKAKAKAMQIVAECENASDYEKLCFYKDVICEMTAYDDTASKESAYGNPWQLIWVFDEDPSTKVVCEGYAKAFQYLCDLSGINCYTVNGVLRSGMNLGAHMWNIVQLEGKNYLVDLTNCEAETAGFPDLLFLAGTEIGNVEEGYTFSFKTKLHYLYKETEITLLGKEVLTLQEENYHLKNGDEKTAFSDVSPSAWYADAVQYVYDQGLMTGSDGTFRPGGSVTRAMVVTTLYRMEGSPQVTEHTACEVFEDVPSNSWYTDAVCWAYEHGITTGNPDTMTFQGNCPVTRQQLSAFFFRYAALTGEDVSIREDLSGMYGAEQVRPYSKEAMEWAVGTGLIRGSLTQDSEGNSVNDLAAQVGATRAQLATMLKRFQKL